jgi:hypothetical protein
MDVNMIKIGDTELDSRYLQEPIVNGSLTQLAFIDNRKKELEMELARLNIARLVFSNSLVKYVNDHPLENDHVIED